MTPTPQPTILDRFHEWCKKNDITLHGQQARAAEIILLGMIMMGGRGAGKTFLLDAIDRFMTEEPPQ